MSTAGRSTTGPAGATVIDIALAEYNSLRSEINSRFTIRATFAGLGLTSIGVVAGFAFSQNGDRRLLLAVPVVAASAMLLLLNESNRIVEIENYIEEKLWPFLRAHVGSDLPGWSDRLLVRRLSISEAARSGTLEAPIDVLFFAVSVGALILAQPASTIIRLLTSIPVLIAVWAHIATGLDRRRRALRLDRASLVSVTKSE